MALPLCELKFGRDKSLRRNHPWVFSGAVAREPEAGTGDLVDVYSHEGEFLGRGAYNPNSQIRVRIFTFLEEPVDTDFFARRIKNANEWRLALLPPETNCYRVCFSEGDRLPGLIVDTYDGYAVIQLQTAGADAQREAIVDALNRVLCPKGIFERSDSGFRLDEGLDKRHGLLCGESPPTPLPVLESGVKLLVDIPGGQKSGLFLDQRDSRVLVRRLARGKSVLNAFSYTGAFAVAALAGGALRAVNVDTSRPSLEMAKAIYAANGFEGREEDFIAQDAFDFLRHDDEHYDIVILDPPAFSKSQASIPRAQRGYKEIIMRGLERLNPGGLLLAFSCSGHIDSEMFQKIAFAAALDMGRNVQILKRLGHSFDHPINIYHPEGEYLCGFLMRMDKENAFALSRNSQDD